MVSPHTICVGRPQNAMPRRSHENYAPKRPTTARNKLKRAETNRNKPKPAGPEAGQLTLAPTGVEGDGDIFLEAGRLDSDVDL